MGGGASTLSAEEIAPTLAKSPLAVDIEADKLAEIAPLFTRVAVAKGDAVARRHGGELMLVESGPAAIQQPFVASNYMMEGGRPDNAQGYAHSPQPQQQQPTHVSIERPCWTSWTRSWNGRACRFVRLRKRKSWSHMNR